MGAGGVPRHARPRSRRRVRRAHVRLHVQHDFATTISQQSAGGGGDYPEAPELGLQQIPQLTWRTDPSPARIAFWVADAPHHEDRAAAMQHAIAGVCDAGVHLYAVSASGTDDLLELTMRSAAEITGGRYLFLTDDSGVGDPHKTPEIPCYYVTKLRSALVRAVLMELSGSYVAPDPAEIIRTVGGPSSDGKCTTQDGQTVQILQSTAFPEHAIRAKPWSMPPPRVYLDWNATTPPLPAVVEAMARAARETWGNPASVHAVGRAARAVVEDAREAVARLAKCDARDVVLTSGGTEANNLALRSAFAGGAGVLVTSRLEHPSVARVAEALEREGRARVRWLRVRREGTIDLEDLDRALSEGGARLVAIQAVNAETGVVQPVREAIAMARRAGALVHVDAVQAFGRSDEICEEADTRSLAGHKMRGPKGIGALVTREGVHVEPLLLGGSQERGLRPGTVDPVAAAGLAVAAAHALGSPVRWASLAALRDALVDGLRLLRPDARVNGAGARVRAPHVASVCFPGWSGPEIVVALDLEGVACSGGSACHSGTAEPSAVLAAMGDDEATVSTARFSLGEDTTRDDVDAALAAAARVLART